MRRVTAKAFLTAVLADIERMTDRPVGPDGANLAFDALGVDSLMALELVVDLERAFGLSLSEEEIRSLRTPNDLVAKAQARGLLTTVEAS